MTSYVDTRRWHVQLDQFMALPEARRDEFARACARFDFLNGSETRLAVEGDKMVFSVSVRRKS